MFRYAYLPLIILILLESCSTPYTITLNNNVVFTPVGRTADSVLADANFQGCLNAMLNINEEMSAETLTSLSCSESDISSLNGIGNLDELALLDLSRNNITDLGPLAGLSKLRVLNISYNGIRNINILNNMPLLSFIDLSGNPDIPCRQLDRLEERLGPSLRRPLSCE